MQNIPYIDIRNSNPVELLRSYPDKAVNLLEASKNTLGILSQLGSALAFPLGDSVARRWLQKTNNPYLEEIDSYTRIVKHKGIFALNLCYEWGCTSNVHNINEGVTLTRVLDWPFPALGENIVVAHQSGDAGEFYNVTWPAVSGIYNAMAPGRFAASLNQAPMRRYRTNIVLDWARNRLRLYNHKGLPPAHLLRRVFETAGNYEEAKVMLSTEAISIPVIYILSGTKPGEGCVIERLEDKAAIRELTNESISAANHFESYLNGIGKGWLPRSYNSAERMQCAMALTKDDIKGFDWFVHPIANPLSRLAMMADAGKGSLSVMGTNGITPATPIFAL